MPKVRRLTPLQQTAILAAYRVHPGASFKSRVDVRLSLIERGYATAARVPLVREIGIKLTAHGLRFAQTGCQIGDKGPDK